ncbi:hypothetical protein BU15DRAFT_58801 [Melanogaster broomeanus]|nr:hypothetical protein BU15DRAFT_58801 [Melanogaster broomeanus]
MTRRIENSTPRRPVPPTNKIINNFSKELRCWKRTVQCAKNNSSWTPKIETSWLWLRFLASIRSAKVALCLGSKSSGTSPVCRGANGGFFQTPFGGGASSSGSSGNSWALSPPRPGSTTGSGRSPQNTPSFPVQWIEEVERPPRRPDVSAFVLAVNSDVGTGTNLPKE